MKPFISKYVSSQSILAAAKLWQLLQIIIIVRSKVTSFL